MGAETAILASTISSAFSIATLIISRIKRYYERSDENGCNPKCACMDHPILSDDHEIEISENMLSDTPVLILRKNSNAVGLVSAARLDARPPLKGGSRGANNAIAS